MQKNLVIVESPAKAKTIEKFLGENYKVLSSYGHIRDLKKKNYGVNLDTFQPEYEIPEDNMFILKDMSKLNRMVKSQRARAHRAQVREIKLRRHTRGLHY